MGRYYEQQKEYRETKAGKEALARANKKFRMKWKTPVFEHYGRTCKCCGEDTFEFLTMDHIKGKKHFRHGQEMVGIKLYRWLVEHNFPKGFKTLCFNCNVAKGLYGTCPHKIY